MVTISIGITFGLILIYLLFYQYKKLSTDSSIGHFLVFMGKRSLDIYFLHYFTLHVNLDFIGEFFFNNPNPFLEYCLAMIIALLLIIASLGMGSIIRLSPITARWLLGEK